VRKDAFLKTATVVAFPNEHTVPVAEPEKWVLGLEYLIPHLDPILAVIRERGKPARVIRLDPEDPPSPRFLGRTPS
jgi:hypothetical protein